MSKTLLRLNQEHLFEFDHKVKTQIADGMNHVVISNGWDLSRTCLFKTPDTTQTAFVETPDDFVLLNEDGTKDYVTSSENSNGEVQSVPISFSPSTQQGTNTVRVYLCCGYNHLDCDGFAVRLYTETTAKKRIYLGSYVYLKTKTTEIRRLSRPIKLSEIVFDRYVEFEIASLEYINEKLRTRRNEFVDLIDGELPQNNLLTVEFSLINGERRNGFFHFPIHDTTRSSISVVDNYKNLEAYCRQIDDRFEYQLRYNGRQIEEFIYQLNSIAGNDYYIEHNVKISERLPSNVEVITAEYTHFQRQDFQRLYKIRPVVENYDSAFVSLDYTVRLINAANGQGIERTGSVSSPSISVFRPTTLKLDVPGYQLKVYNKVIGQGAPAKFMTERVIQKVVQPVYISTASFVSNAYVFPTSPSLVSIPVLDSKNTALVPVPGTAYSLVCYDTDGGELINVPRDERLRDAFAFWISDDSAQRLRKAKNGVFSILAKSAEKTTTVISYAFKI